MWIDAKERPPSKSDPIVIRKDACVSVGMWSDEWHGWVTQADGFNARNHLDEVIVIDKPDYWFRVPDLELE